MNLAIIPARGGSRRIPGKNIRLFHGKPIIAYSIETARASRLFEKVVVSTENTKIQAVARAYGAKLHNRPAALCDNDIGTQAVMRCALHWWMACQPEIEAEYACCIYATAPMLTAQDLQVGLAAIGSKPYAYVPGLYYWGRADAFLNDVPLSDGVEVPFPHGRYVDINTEEDWQRAERMYADLNYAMGN